MCWRGEGFWLGVFLEQSGPARIYRQLSSF